MSGALDSYGQRIAQIGAVPTILRVVGEVTGLRLALLARARDVMWRACAVHDRMEFGHDVRTPLSAILRGAELLFRPYLRGTSGNPRMGLGLGLDIVSQIPKSHGRHVEAGSTHDEGTPFTCTLPLAASLGR